MCRGILTPPLLASYLIGEIAAAGYGLDMLGCSTLDTSSHTIRNCDGSSEEWSL